MRMKLAERQHCPRRNICTVGERLNAVGNCKRVSHCWSKALGDRYDEGHDGAPKPSPDEERLGPHDVLVEKDEILPKRALDVTALDVRVHQTHDVQHELARKIPERDANM